MPVSITMIRDLNERVLVCVVHGCRHVEREGKTEKFVLPRQPGTETNDHQILYQSVCTV